MDTKNMAVSAQQQQQRTAVSYFMAFVAMATLFLLPDIANAAAASTLAQPDVGGIVKYIKGLATGPAFEIGSAGLMLGVGIKGLKRIRGAF